jgi:hypothetical protein
VRPALQVWTPFFWRSPFDEAYARDLKRAQREWRGEHRLWLDKDAKKVTRWRRIDDGMLLFECIIPSETINCFVISHVDGKGRVYPYLPLPDDWHGSVSGAYIRWLKESAKIYLINSEYRKMPMPVIKDGDVSIVDAKILMAPEPFPRTISLSDDGVMKMLWPKTGNAEMLAPNQELKAVFGEARYERQVIDGHEFLLAVSEKDPQLRAISTQYGWADPFSYMFGEGGGVDLMMHKTFFKKCLDELKGGQTAKAVKEADTWLGVLTSPGRTTIWHSWFAPMAQANQEEALFAVETQYGVSAKSIQELHGSAEFWRIMNTNVDILVAHDWLGYFWWDLYQDLKENVTIRCCEACGRVIRGGHNDRRFCSRRENPECYQKRNTISQRKKRTHES